MVIFLGGLTMAVTKKSMKDEGLCCCFYDPKKISYGWRFLVFILIEIVWWMDIGDSGLIYYWCCIC
jgi:hypothetical protein